MSRIYGCNKSGAFFSDRKKAWRVFYHKRFSTNACETEKNVTTIAYCKFEKHAQILKKVLNEP